MEITGVPETNTYTVTFNSNGGSEVASITDLTDGATISKPTDPTKEGKDFGGWYKESGLTNSFDFDNDTISDSIILYAKWITPLTPGTEITINNEPFYYLWDDEEDNTKAVLIAKYNLNQAGTAQAPNESYETTACRFSGTYYWSINNTNNLNLNTYPIPESETISNNAIKKAQNYATKKVGNGATGRLLTRQEKNLFSGTTMNNILNGKANQQGEGSTNYYLRYWLASSNGSNKVFYTGNSTTSVEFYSNSDKFGVRPVIVIPKANL